MAVMHVSGDNNSSTQHVYVAHMQATTYLMNALDLDGPLPAKATTTVMMAATAATMTTTTTARRPQLPSVTAIVELLLRLRLNAERAFRCM